MGCHDTNYCSPLDQLVPEGLQDARRGLECFRAVRLEVIRWTWKRSGSYV